METDDTLNECYAITTSKSTRFNLICVLYLIRNAFALYYLLYTLLSDVMLEFDCIPVAAQVYLMLCYPDISIGNKNCRFEVVSTNCTLVYKQYNH